LTSETIVYIVLAGIAALLLALFQYIYKSRKSRQNIIYAVLRFITYFCILLLLLNPKFEKLTVFEEKPTLVVAVDNSESIKHLNQEENLNGILSNLKANESLKNKFDIDYFSFGSDITILDSLSFNKTQTNIAKVYKSISEIYRAKNAPVLLLTDGNQTYGEDYEYASDQLNQVIFPVIMGDTARYSDLKIQQLNVNKFAYHKNKFPVEIIVTFSGEGNADSQLTISSGNSVLFRQNVAFSESKRSHVITAELPADRVGVNTYSVRLQPLNSERNSINNQKPFAVEVIDQRTNVVIVSDIVHPDIGALRKSIETNEQRSVTILAPDEYLEQSEDFQLVILYQPNSAFSNIFNQLNSANTNRLIITGTQTDWNFLNSTQNMFSLGVTNQTENYLPELNSNYNTFIIDDLDFSSFPPLASEFGDLTVNVPFQSLISKRVGNSILDQPMWLSLEDSGRKESLLLGENLWRWRAQSFLNNRSFQKFDNFIGKVVQYLASNKRRTRLDLNYESFYNGTGDILITAQFFNKNYEFDPNSKLNINVTNTETNQVISMPFVLMQNKYQLDLSGFQAGVYNFLVQANDGEVSQSGTITILEFNVEQQFLNADVNKLRAIASTTEGNAFFYNQEQQLIDTLLNDDRFVTLQKSTKNVVPLVDFKILLAIIVLSLTAEWFLRKYNGLI